jgi:transposase
MPEIIRQTLAKFGGHALVTSAKPRQSFPGRAAVRFICHGLLEEGQEILTGAATDRLVRRTQLLDRLLVRRYLVRVLAESRQIIEGVNNKIKVIKRKAYGFHDPEYFALKVKQALPGTKVTTETG